MIQEQSVGLNDNSERANMKM